MKATEKGREEPSTGPRGDTRRWRPSMVAGDVLAAVRAGLGATAIACLGVAAFVLHSETLPEDNRMAVAVVVGVAALVAGILAAMLRRMNRAPSEAGPLLTAWSLIDLALIGIAAAVSGGWQSPLLWLLLLPVVYFTVLLDTRTSGLLVLASLAVAAIAGWLGNGEFQIGRAVLQGTVLAVIASITSYLSQVLASEVEAARASQAAAERRAQLLDVTAAATRSLMGLDPDVVLRNLVEATASMGFGGVALFVPDGEEPGLVCQSQVGLGPKWEGRRLSPGQGLVSEVLELRRTVVVTRYDTYERGIRELRDAGFHTVVGLPVVAQDDEVLAVLAAGSRRKQQLDGEELEALESLAVHAGLALRNARAFELEALARQQLTELSDLHHDFVATASHELRTPLTIVRGVTELLAARWEDLGDIDRDQLIERLSRHSRDMVRLVDRLQHLDELRHGGVEPRKRETDLAPLVDAVVADLDSAVDDHLVTWHRPQDCKALADPRLIHQVVLELVDNAVRHAPAGTHVHVGVASTAGELEIAVADDGPGIPPDQLARITHEYRRVGDVLTRSSRGLGIGLALAKRVLDLHDSRLVFRGRSSGTHVCFRLPAVATDDDGDQVLRLGDLVTSRRRDVELARQAGGRS